MVGLYVPLSAHYWMDDKLADVSAEAELLYVRALGHCKQLLNDGFVHRNRLNAVCPVFRTAVAPDDLAAELVEAGLWEPVERGWRVCAWLKHNDSAAAVDEKRRAEAERKATWRARRDAEPATDMSQRSPASRDADATDMSQRTTASRVPPRDAQIETEEETEVEEETPPPPPTPSMPTRRAPTGAGGGGGGRTFSADQLDAIETTVQRLVDIEHERANLTGRPVQNPAAWRRQVAKRIRTDHADSLADHAHAGTDPRTAALTIAGWAPDGPTPDDWQALTAARIRWESSETPAESPRNGRTGSSAMSGADEALRGVGRGAA